MRYYISGNEPRAEQIPTELAPGSVSSCGELGTATVDYVEGVPTVGAIDGGWTACEVMPIHDRANVCGATFACEK